VTEVVTSIDIDAPPERVWALAMDPNCLSEWVTIHRRLHGHDDGPPRKGYAMEQTLHLRGVNFKVHWELVECDKGHHAEWHGRGPARSHGTRFDYRNEFTAPLGPLGRVASRAVVGGLPRREADASLRKLKKLAEGG
jgi:hypothetical protein